MTGSVEDRGIRPVRGVLFDLLMAVMDTPAAWAAAAQDRRRGLAWRDAVTARMIASSAYAPYEGLVAKAARELGLPADAAAGLFEGWLDMRPWPDAAALARLSVPYAFVTNCSAALAEIAANRSGLRPRFVLSAEDAGLYKPDPRVYRAACRQLGTLPGDTLFVAGSAYDADGAQRAGLRAMFIARRADQRVVDPHILVVASLGEVVALIDT